MTKILVVSQELPYPLNTGGQVSIFSRLKSLSNSYEVDLCAANLEQLILDSEFKQNLSFLNKIVVFEREIPRLFAKGNMVKSIFLFLYNFIFTKLPRGAYIAKNKRIQEFLKQNANLYDVILFENYNSFYNYLALKNSCFKNNKVGLITHNIESSLAYDHVQIRRNILSKFYLWIEYLKIKFYEKEVYKKAPFTLCISKIDYKNLKKNVQGNFKFIAQHLRINDRVWKFNNSKKVIFNANLNFLPNVEGLSWYLQNVHFKVIEKEPNYQLVLTGNISKAQLKKIENYSNILCTGFLTNEEFYELFYSCDVMINPVFKGAGVKIKMLDAIGVGIPIVSTSHSTKGLDDILNIQQCDDAETFSQAVIKILSQKTSQHSFGANAYNDLLNKKIKDIFYE